MRGEREGRRFGEAERQEGGKDTERGREARGGEGQRGAARVCNV